MTMDVNEARFTFERLDGDSRTRRIRLFVNSTIDIKIEKSTFTRDIGVRYEHGAVQMTVLADMISYTGFTLYCYKKGMCIATFDLPGVVKVVGYDEKGAVMQ